MCVFLKKTYDIFLKLNQNVHISTLYSLAFKFDIISFRHLYTKTKISSKSTNFVHTLTTNINMQKYKIFLNTSVYIPGDVCFFPKTDVIYKKNINFFLNLILRFSFVCQLYTHSSPLQNFFCCTCFTKNREEYKYLFRL